jgi:L-2,4-diaminobutyric acid acetyltransferase
MSDVVIRRPEPADGRLVHDLVGTCPPLDPNSLYANLLQCTHFAGTCAIADAGGRAVGWVGGYLLPSAPEVLFVWQVAVHAAARGRGLGVALVLDILRRPGCTRVRHAQATVTDDNTSSWRMFRALAAALDAPCDRAPLFERDRHFGGAHATEFLLRIGPFIPPGADVTEVQ